MYGWLKLTPKQFEIKIKLHYSKANFTLKILILKMFSNYDKDHQYY